MNQSRRQQSLYYTDLAQKLVSIDRNNTGCDCCGDACSAGMKDRSHRLIGHLRCAMYPQVWAAAVMGIGVVYLLSYIPRVKQ